MKHITKLSNKAKAATGSALIVGATVVAGASYADDGPTQNQCEDLQADYDTAQDKIADLQEKKTLVILDTTSLDSQRSTSNSRKEFISPFFFYFSIRP